MCRTREEILEDRRRLRSEYGDLFEAVTAILFHADPIGINFEVNPGEYQSEAGTILPRLRFCGSPEDVTRVVHEEFVRWFSTQDAGSRDRYRDIADEIWDLWQRSAIPKHNG